MRRLLPQPLLPVFAVMAVVMAQACGVHRNYLAQFNGVILAIATSICLAIAAQALAHDAVTLGPNGGRVIYIDSNTTPHAEVLVSKEGRVEVSLLDKDRKPISFDQRSLSVTAGPRATAKKLAVEKQGDKFVSEPVPDGAPYIIVLQLKENPSAKALTLRLNYDPTPTAAGKPAYLDDSVNAYSGENIAVPDTVAGLWAELNQHQDELVEGVADKKYEAIDEITRAYPVLAKSLPSKSGDRQAIAADLVASLVKHIAAVRDASAARKLEDAKAPMAALAVTLGDLKKLYPEEVANARLKP